MPTATVAPNLQGGSILIWATKEDLTMLQENVEGPTNLSSKRVVELHRKWIKIIKAHGTNCRRDDDKKLEGN